jgi:undecaprenyl pyrophosphate phosphatase UppP
MKFMLSWLMLARKRWVGHLTSYAPIPSTTHFILFQDFVAAEKKALKVGAKKFFLEVHFSTGDGLKAPLTSFQKGP